ncbi:HAD-IA family hydrolase [Sneathiella chinensis]|uniref:Haloacid dehalogenase n=1 Tax=Sneathiella chinensis TaxID=349750 RepID=A0ABQ5U921_9PROT|nr:HAD-IA family hydrolase [Sneathiella chinensis]GLQ07749.1 haloacid dehalogenase [Sneathiella chinensis]
MVNDSPLKLVVFDCDGTLVDSQYNIISCMDRAFEESGLIPPEGRAVRSIIGLNLDQAIHELMEDKEDFDLLARLVESYRQAFKAQRLSADHHEPLFEGVREILEQLEADGVLMGVATGKSMRGLKAVIEQHGLEKYFITLQTPDHNPGKPHPQMLEKAMDMAGVGPENTLMIGDTSFDMMLAKNAGSTAVGITWGYHDRDILIGSGADHLIDNFAPLPGLLAGLGR